MDREELISIINEAFDGVPQPKEITMHVAEAHDHYDYHHDEVHRQKDFIGRWQDIPHEHVQSCQAALCYVEKVGMRFYLPAYMVWYLKDLGSNATTFDNTLYLLDNHPADPQLSEYYKERFSLFTPQQLRACALFVKCFAEDTSGFSDAEFAQEKYDRHWSKYEKI